MKRSALAFLLLGALLSGLAHSGDLLPNGDFEQADAANPNEPAHWDRMDGLAVSWTKAPTESSTSSHGMAIRMDTSLSETVVVNSYKKEGLSQWVFPHPQSNAIAETYGLSLYSDAIPLKPGATYQVTFDYLAEAGTAGKLWFRAYGEVNGQKKRVYEGTVDCAGDGPAWKQFRGLFHPTKYTANATEFKIMLYAYYPAGVAWFDNLRVEEVDAPAPAP